MKRELLFPVFRSWRTTILGLAAAVTIILSAETVTPEIVSSAVAVFLVGGVARDSAVSSQRAGVRP